MYKPHSAGGIIVNNIEGNLHIAMADQTEASDGPNGYWSFPKGHIEDSEDTLTTSYREIWEEIGIEKKDLKLIGILGEYERSSTSPSGNTVMKKITFYHFTTEITEIQSNDNNNLYPKWIPIDEVSAKLGNKVDAIFFESIKEKISHE